MSKPIDEQTLLPDNRTSFERSFEEGFKKLVKSPDVLAAIADPCTTSKEILPIIASERGVNDWFFFSFLLTAKIVGFFLPMILNERCRLSF